LLTAIHVAEDVGAPVAHRQVVLTISAVVSARVNLAPRTQRVWRRLARNPVGVPYGAR
jgi:hypothetical protein